MVVHLGRASASGKCHLTTGRRLGLRRPFMAGAESVYSLVGLRGTRRPRAGGAPRGACAARDAAWCRRVPRLALACRRRCRRLWSAASALGRRRVVAKPAAGWIWSRIWRPPSSSLKGPIGRPLEQASRVAPARATMSRSSLEKSGSPQKLIETSCAPMRIRNQSNSHSDPSLSIQIIASPKSRPIQVASLLIVPLAAAAHNLH